MYQPTLQRSLRLYRKICVRSTKRILGYFLYKSVLLVAWKPFTGGWYLIYFPQHDIGCVLLSSSFNVTECLKRKIIFGQLDSYIHHCLTHDFNIQWEFINQSTVLVLPFKVLYYSDNSQLVDYSLCVCVCVSVCVCTHKFYTVAYFQASRIMLLINWPASLSHLPELSLGTTTVSATIIITIIPCYSTLATVSYTHLTLPTNHRV